MVVPQPLTAPQAALVPRYVQPHAQRTARRPQKLRRTAHADGRRHSCVADDACRQHHSEEDGTSNCDHESWCNGQVPQFNTPTPCWQRINLLLCYAVTSRLPAQRRQCRSTLASPSLWTAPMSHQTLRRMALLLLLRTPAIGTNTEAAAGSSVLGRALFGLDMRTCVRLRCMR